MIIRRFSWAVVFSHGSALGCEDSSSPNGNDSKTSVEIIDGKMMIVSVSEVMSDDKRAVVRFTLGRAPPTEDKQLTK